MLPAKRLLAPIRILLILAFVPGSARAQPSRVDHWALEARIAQAESVVLGPIIDVSCKAHDSDGQVESTPTLKVEEVLKGKGQGRIADLQPSCSLESDKRYQEWMKAKTRLLWFLGPAKAGQRRTWHAVAFGKVVPSEALFGGRSEPPMFSADFTLLGNEKDILARARAYAKTSTTVAPVHWIRMPPVAREGGWISYVVVPVDKALEKLAKRLLSSPADFVRKGKKLDPLGRYLLRYGGVDSLRYFESAANIALLESLLDEPLENYQSSFVPQHPVGVKAFEVLLHWGVDVPLPKRAGRITRLDLAGTNVTDAGLEKVGRLKNLTHLDLRNTSLTHTGLQRLAGLRKLGMLSLSQGQLSDANLRVLRAIGLLHTVTQAAAEDGKRPASAKDVATLELCRSPVTNAGLKEILVLENLAWLDLRETRVTDAGSKDLARLPKLTRLLLQGTRLTKAGIAELRKALLGCKIDF